MKRYTDRSIRAYRDSQRKLAIAKRRYADALRRYRDAEDDVKASKIRVLIDKIDEKFGMFAKDHPELVKAYKRYKEVSYKISANFNAIIAGAGAGMTARLLLELKKDGMTLKQIGMSAPKVIGMFLISLANAIIAYVEWKKGKELEKERLASEN